MAYGGNALVPEGSIPAIPHNTKNNKPNQYPLNLKQKQNILTYLSISINSFYSNGIRVALCLIRGERGEMGVDHNVSGCSNDNNNNIIINCPSEEPCLFLSTNNPLLLICHSLKPMYRVVCI